MWQDSCTHCGRGTPLVDYTLGAPEKSQLWADVKGQWHKDDFQMQVNKHILEKTFQTDLRPTCASWTFSTRSTWNGALAPGLVKIPTWPRSCRPLGLCKHITTSCSFGESLCKGHRTAGRHILPTAWGKPSDPLCSGNTEEEVGLLVDPPPTPTHHPLPRRVELHPCAEDVRLPWKMPHHPLQAPLSAVPPWRFPASHTSFHL